MDFTLQALMHTDAVAVHWAMKLYKEVSRMGTAGVAAVQKVFGWRFPR